MFNQPQIDQVTLPCRRLPPAFDGLTLLHLSDLHIVRWTKRLSLWRNALAHLHPDIVAITGDLGHRAWLWRATLTNLVRMLELLHPPLGAYFILGNHDSLKLGPALNAHGLTYLRNQAVFLAPRTSVAHPSEAKTPPSITTPRLALIGIDQHRRIDTDIPAAMQTVRPNDFKLMLLHYPDLIFQAAGAGADICLAGHTHGGQICWPDGRPIIRHDTLPQEMCTGVHRVNGTWMVVNRGIGTAGFRVRMFCPSQAIMLTLRSS